MEPEAHGDVVVVVETAVEHGEAATGMPQLDPTVWPNLIFWLIVSIVILYLVLSRVALPRLSAVLSERHDAISNDIEMAALLKRRAEEAERAYDKALADARDEANRIADATRADMQAELKALMAKAEAEIVAQSAESEKRIAEIRAGATESIEAVAKEAGLAIVESLMPKLADRGAVDAAVAGRVRG
jgi:F-type H+-transporting ATPase subunit b